MPKDPMLRLVAAISTAPLPIAGVLNGRVDVFLLTVGITYCVFRFYGWADRRMDRF
jgi:hypothetical protein